MSRSCRGGYADSEMGLLNISVFRDSRALTLIVEEFEGSKPFYFKNCTLASIALQVLGFTLVKDIGFTGEGIQCAELTAFCIHPLARGAGRGDSLLDFLEQVGAARP